ncbi:MAG: class I SAM-dependent methyltransferase [Chloroflexi bacterium]|nr:class I SAM-dependent methyltransferase [Chloroflexota bacterium]
MEIHIWKERWAAALREQHQVLFDAKAKSLKPEFVEYINCPVCDSPRSSFLFEKDWFRYVQCRNCSMVYMNPRMNLAATHSFYNSNANAIYNEAKFKEVPGEIHIDDQINHGNMEMLDQYRNHQKGVFLEIGSAKGALLSKAREMGYEIYGLELNQVNCEYARRKLGDTILNMDLSEARFEAGKFDVVYMRDVIEHIANPNSFLHEVSRITKPGGLIFLETHNIESWINRFARERHVVIFGFEHPNHWSPKTLGLALSQNGYVVQKTMYASLDCTLADMLDYMVTPSFTAVFPQPVGRVKRLVAKRLLAMYRRFRVVSLFDRKYLPRLANYFRKGSVMKVIARKSD